MRKKLELLFSNDYVYSVITKIISVASGVVYAILYNRYLGAELKGTAAVINNYSEMIMLVLCFGVYQAYPFYKKKTGDPELYSEFINKISGMLILYSAIIAVFIFLIHPGIEVGTMMVLIPLLMGIRQFNYLVMIENPKLRNTTQVILDLFDIVFVVALMAFTEANMIWCILFLIIKNLIWFGAAIFNLRINLFSIRPSLCGVFKYVRYGFLPMLTIILMEINYKIDVLMLERMGSQKFQIGVYSVGVMIAQKLWMIPDALKDILTSKLTKGKSTSEVCLVSRLSFTIMIMCILVIAACGQQCIVLLFGPDFRDAYTIFLIVVAGSLGMVFYKMIYAFNVVKGNKTINFVLLMIAALINVVLNWFLIPSYDIVGAGVASLISYSVCGVSFLATFCYSNSISPQKLLIVTKDDVKHLVSFVKKKS